MTAPSLDAVIRACLPPLDAHRAGTLAAAREMLQKNPGLTESSVVVATLVGAEQRLGSELERDPSVAKQRFPPHDWPLLLYLCFSLFYRDDLALRPCFHRMAGELLAAGADPRAYFMCGEEKETALYGATGVANDAILGAMLLDAGADVDDEDAAYHIAEHASCDAIRLLFTRGLRSDLRVTTLLHKLDEEDVDGVRTILDLGVDLNARGRWGKTALHQAIMRGRSIPMLELLLERGADVNAMRDDGKSAYALAARIGRQEVMELLQANGADTTLSEQDQLLTACALADRDAIDALLARSPELVAQLSAEDHVALVEAARDGNTRAVELMLDAGMPVAARGVCGGTALHWAAWHGRADTVRVLVQHGAPLDCLCTSYRNSPLGWGVYGATACGQADGNYEEVVAFLLEQGAAIEAYMWGDASPPMEALLRAEVQRRERPHR